MKGEQYKLSQQMLGKQKTGFTITTNREKNSSDVWIKHSMAKKKAVKWLLVSSFYQEPSYISTHWAQKETVIEGKEHFLQQFGFCVHCVQADLKTESKLIRVVIGGKNLQH